MNGKELEHITRETFDLTDTEDITTKQINYVLQMAKPTNYLLAHHTIGGKPVTYNVPNHNEAKALQHRPWQLDPLNDMSKDMVVTKGRQMGFSEVGISQLIYFADTHSFDRVNCLYAFNW